MSSAGATTSAILLYRGGAIEPVTATVAILIPTASSVAVKAGLTAAGPSKPFAWRVTPWSAVILLVAGGVTVVTLL